MLAESSWLEVTGSDQPTVPEAVDADQDVAPIPHRHAFVYLLIVLRIVMCRSTEQGQPARNVAFRGSR